MDAQSGHCSTGGEVAVAGLATWGAMVLEQTGHSPLSGTWLTLTDWEGWLTRSVYIIADGSGFQDAFARAVLVAVHSGAGAGTVGQVDAANAGREARRSTRMGRTRRR